MSNPKRHHYLPEFYLKKFAYGNKFWVYDREKDEYRLQTPKNTAVQGYYYSYIDEAGNRNTEIEEILSYIEGETKPIIENVHNNKAINRDEKNILAIFVSLLKLRVPEFEKTYNEATEKTIKKIMKFYFLNEDMAKELIKKTEEKRNIKLEVDPKDLIDIVQNEKYNLQFDRIHSLQALLQNSQKFSSYFLEMDWMILKASKGFQFITSDDPFVLVPPKDYSPYQYWGVGFLTKGSRKIVPLSSKTCLVLCDKGDSITYENVSKKDVESINAIIAFNCDRFVISRNLRNLKKLVNFTKINQWKVGSRVHVG